MKRAFAIVLAAMLVFSLCACGGTPAQTTEATTEPTTEATTEPIADITVYAKIPEGWSDPACWAWQNVGSDAFKSWPGEAMILDSDWYSVNVPGWIDYVIINGNDGSVQTADLAVEAGRDVWIHVVNADYAFVHYEKPTEEQLDAERDQPALDYHTPFFRGDYQITGTKAVAFNDTTGRYCTDYVPEELLAETPEEAYYRIRLVNANEHKGYYLGAGVMTPAIKLGLKIQIEELASGKVLATSNAFMGSEPPQSIRSGDSGTGTPPDAAAIEAWIRSEFEEILKSTPTDMPMIPLNEEALTEEEKAALEARELALRLGLSYAELVEWLVEYEDYTQEEAKTAADNCGLDWKEMALLSAQEDLLETPNFYNGYYSYASMLDYLMNVKMFKEEEAQYAVDNCDLDWMEQALLQAKWLTDDEEGSGYSKGDLGDCLTMPIIEGGGGFSSEEAAYAVENCNADWAKEAVKRAAWILKYSNKTFTKEQMVKELTNYYGFSSDDAVYGAEKNGLK